MPDRLPDDFPSDEELALAHFNLRSMHAQIVCEKNAAIYILEAEAKAARLEADTARDEIAVLKKENLQLAKWKEYLVSVLFFGESGE
jgi:hypothetical protein